MYDIVIVQGDRIIGQAVASTDGDAESAKDLLKMLREVNPRPFGTRYRALLYSKDRTVLCTW